MTRSIWKVPYIYNAYRNRRITPSKVLNVYRRGYIIHKLLINKRINIYNGKKFVSFRIIPKHVGYKLGQFVYTKAKGWAVWKAKMLKKGKLRSKNKMVKSSNNKNKSIVTKQKLTVNKGKPLKVFSKK